MHNGRWWRVMKILYIYEPVRKRFLKRQSNGGARADRIATTNRGLRNSKRFLRCVWQVLCGKSIPEIFSFSPPLYPPRKKKNIYPICLVLARSASRSAHCTSSRFRAFHQFVKTVIIIIIQTRSVETQTSKIILFRYAEKNILLLHPKATGRTDKDDKYFNYLGSDDRQVESISV